MKLTLKIATTLIIVFITLCFINKPKDEYVVQRFVIDGKSTHSEKECFFTYRKVNYILFDIWKNDCGESYYSFWGNLYQRSFKTIDVPNKIGK